MIFATISGWMGTVIILIAYLLVSTKKIGPNSTTYQILNLIGALGIIINTLVTKAWPATVLFVVWAAMAAIYLANIIKKQKK